MTMSARRTKAIDQRAKRIAESVLIAAVLLVAASALVTALQSRSISAAPESLNLSAKSPAQPQVGGLKYGFFVALTGNNVAARNMGFNWVEYGIYWSDEEPSPGNYSWLNGPNNVDNVADAARNAGVNLLIRISQTPAWARDPSCSQYATCPPANVGDFGRFAGALAARVRTRLSGQSIAYEIWNEPNSGDQWGFLQPDPARYTSLLRSAYPQIKAADPSATVAGGALTTVAEQRLTIPHMDDLQFLQGMYDAGAAPYFDVLSDHPYGFISPPEQDPVSGNTGLVFRRAERHHDYMVANGDGNKQIWATEMGWAIDPRTEGQPCQPPDWYFIFNQQQQADYLVRAYQWARSYWPWMGAMFTWNFDFDEASWYQQCDAFRYFSVKDRLAENALRNLALNPPPTYTPVLASVTPTVPVDNPPTITAVRYSALHYTRTGGTLTVEVDAYDEDSTPIDTVDALLGLPGGGSQLFVLSLVSGNNENGTWSVSISLPANNGDGPQYYTVSPYAVETFPPRRTTNAPVQQIMVANTRFWDVLTTYWAYPYIEALASRGVIGGYPDGSFRPGNQATRGQLSKIEVLAFNMPLISPPTAHFYDVPVGSTFFTYVETAYAHGLISGYPCGGPGEPCDPQRRPYFRPNNSVTRGQIAKITSLASGWQLLNPPTATFADVPVGSTFFTYVETAFAHGVLSGYPCGGPGEPCDPQSRPYFRPGSLATRAQICKIIDLSSAAPPTATPTPVPTLTPTLTPPAPTVTRTPTPTQPSPTATLFRITPSSTPSPADTATATATTPAPQPTGSPTATLTTPTTTALARK
jgi:hypothetical protein